MRLAGLLLSLPVWMAAAEPKGKIMRPTDRAVLPDGDVDIIATAPGGKLFLDGRPAAAEQPFPNVFHAVLKTSAGLHTLALTWEGGQVQTRFFAGAGAPEGFRPFHRHPPVAELACAQCHEISSRGRFRFKTGACFDCHQRDGFAKVHSHEPAILDECGLCHNAHGSTMKANLLYPKETACKQCHD